MKRLFITLALLAGCVNNQAKTTPAYPAQGDQGARIEELLKTSEDDPGPWKRVTSVEEMRRELAANPHAIMLFARKGCHLCTQTLAWWREHPVPPDVKIVLWLETDDPASDLGPAQDAFFALLDPAVKAKVMRDFGKCYVLPIAFETSCVGTDCALGVKAMYCSLPNTTDGLFRSLHGG